MIIRDINIKKTKYTTFFDDIINVKDFDLNNVRIDKKSYENILIFYVAHVTIKSSKYVKINSVKPL